MKKKKQVQLPGFLVDLRRLCREIASGLYRFWNGERYSGQMKEQTLQPGEQPEGPRRSEFFQNWELELGEPLPHPVRRFFARTVDLSLLALLWKCYQWLVMGVYSWMGGIGAKVSWWDWALDRYVIFGLMFVFEPFLLALFGTTPGKWLFGLTVRARRGGKLSYVGAFKRTWDLFVHGMGFGIPVLDLWCLWKSFLACRRGEQAAWELLRQYRIKDTKTWRSMSYLGFLFLIGLVELSVLMFVGRPVHRGSVTPEQFAEDTTRLAHWYGLDQTLTMGADGKWRNPSGYVSYVRMGRNGRWAKAEGLISYSLETENGYVSGISLYYHNRGRDWIDAMTGQKAVAVLSFLGSKEDISPLEWAWWNIRMETELLNQGGPKNGSYEWNFDETVVSQTVVTDGFEYAPSYDFYQYQTTPFTRNFELNFTVRGNKKN